MPLAFSRPMLFADAVTHAANANGVSDAASQPTVWIASVVVLCVCLLAARLMLRSASSASVVSVATDCVLHALPQGVIVLGPSGRIRFINAAARRMIGFNGSGLIGRMASSLRWVRAPQAGSADDPWNGLSMGRMDSGQQWMRFQIESGVTKTFAVQAVLCRDPVAQESQIVVTLQDVTEVERRADDREKMLAILRQDRSKIHDFNRRLHKLASVDPLTQCLNRRSFFTVLEKSWQECERGGLPLSVLIIDNDRFKLINDTHGHGVGDEVLQAVAAVLLRYAGSGASVCRYGGEEFCIALPTIDLEDALVFAEHLRSEISKLRFESTPQLNVTASIGVASSETPGREEMSGREEISGRGEMSDPHGGESSHSPPAVVETDGATGAAVADPVAFRGGNHAHPRLARTPVELIGRADRMLYRAKSEGRNRVVAFRGDDG